MAYAAQEKADVLGLSILSGSHLPLCEHIRELLRERGMDGILWLVGGNIPPGDHDRLRELGVAAVFGVGSSLQAIGDFIHENMS